MMTTDFRWWMEDYDGRRHEAIMAYVRSLEELQYEVHNRFFQNSWLYNQSGVQGADGEWKEPWPVDAGAVTTNLCESLVDTAVAMIARHQPRITIQTDGADFSTRRKAVQLEKYLEAEFQRMQVYDDAVDMFRDGAVLGTGCLAIVEEDGRPEVERVLIDEIIVDERACRVSPPRWIHRRRFVDRDVLKNKYPKYEEEIDKAADRGSMRTWTTFRTSEANQVPFVEAWHLPSGPGAKDGMYCATIEGTDLACEPYTDDDVPFVFFHWSKRMTGFYGRSLVEQVAGKQLRMNKLNYVIQRGQDLVARPRMFLAQADAHLKDQIDNGIAHVFVTRSGKEYGFSTSQAFGPEVYQQRRDLIMEAYQETGISEAAASGQRPPGVESAVAIAEVAERETGRFAIQAERFENVFVSVARKVIALQKRLGGGGHAVWKTRNLLRKIPWADVDMEADMYTMSVEPASILSRSPARRKQSVIELAQANLLKDRDEARMLLGHPDLQRSEDLATAARRDIERTIELLEDEAADFPPPEPFQNLGLGLVMTQQHYLDIKGQGAPEGVLQRFRDWMTLAQNLVIPPQAAPVPGGPEAVPPENGTAMSPVGNRYPGMGAVEGLGPQAMSLSPDAMGLVTQ